MQTLVAAERDESMPPSLDWEDWGNWLLTDRGLKPSYVDVMLRRAGSMTRGGVDWSAFHEGPDAARRAPRAFLADLRRRGAVNMMRSCQKALNLLAAYLAETDPRYRDLDPLWPLVSAPKRRLDPYEPEEVARIAGAARATFKGLRQAAMVWLLCNCIIRKTELWSLQRTDLDPARGGFVLQTALKDGLPGFVILPLAAWRPGNPFHAYLQARDALAGPRGALWVTETGRPISSQGLAGDMHDLRLRSGVKANFNRFRHTRNTIFEENNVPLQVAQRENRHGDPKSTMWYAHGSIQRRRETLVRCRVPGFEDEPLGPAISEKWARLGLPPVARTHADASQDPAATAPGSPGA